ncbi:MAG TPA: SDR family NAD(P)-dependent oxidoreductase [Amaricoccus sp.]|nr:SDR family NAD(P)-dependent oxidoreductase [Amaricoccus sp.]
MPDPDPQRSVLITGCSSGIGLDAARTLRARGWRVLATCRQPADCERLEAEGLESFQLDLADEAGLAVAAEEALARTAGRLDALVNNGAFAIPGAVEDLPRAAFRAIFETNLFGQIDLTSRLLPAMRAAGQGRVVMVSSVLGLVAAPWRGAYVATKFALEGATDALRLELAGSGIAVVLVEPGPIATPFRRNSIPHFERHVDWRSSPHRAAYEATLLRRLYEPGARDRFELPPAAVTRRLVAALESPRPRPRYFVTAPTHAVGLLRRLLSTRALDALVRRR